MMTAALREWDAVRIEVGEGIRVPLLGTVGRGAPLGAFHVEDGLELPAGLWNGRRVFGLRVRGASMMDDGIRDGDHLIVEARETAEIGQTVVADVDGVVTVKRLFGERDGGVRLQPANPAMLPLVVRPERVRVIGVVVGVFRRQGFRRSGSPPRPGRPAHADGQTLDLSLRVIEQSVDRAESLAAARTGRSAERLRTLTRSLRGLRDWYLHTRVPRLREALLREAGELVRRLHRFGAEHR